MWSRAASCVRASDTPSATLLADSGADLEVIAELAGHADVLTTKGFVSVPPARRAAAVHQV